MSSPTQGAWECRHGVDGRDHCEECFATTLKETYTEWQVELTWVDWRKAGATGPVSTIGPFLSLERAQAFLTRQRADRDIAATRLLTRQVTSTPWTPADGSEPSPVSDEEREQLRKALFESILADSRAAKGLHDV